MAYKIVICSFVRSFARDSKYEIIIIIVIKSYMKIEQRGNTRVRITS